MFCVTVGPRMFFIATVILAKSVTPGQTAEGIICAEPTGSVGGFWSGNTIVSRPYKKIFCNLSRVTLSATKHKVVVRERDSW